MRFAPLIRRARIALAGQLSPVASFYLQTDAANIGSNGDRSPRRYILDAFTQFNLDPAIQIDVGLVPVPFSHIGMQAAATDLGIDHPQMVIMPPPSVYDAHIPSMHPTKRGTTLAR